MIVRAIKPWLVAVLLLIVPAANGRIGLDLDKRLPIDCVVLETNLPDRSGFEVLVTLPSV